jgi:pyridinium-3,5-bisthiocarboxylic acid mononucleotide nickel chelatase
MKILIVDPIGGISGDMLLGSLVHLGCPTEYLEETFSKMDIEPFSLHTSEDSINGISCIGLRFDIPKSHEGRTYASIRDTILPGLPGAIRTNAGKVFHALAQAESEVHGCAIEDVHFHEIGALDSILDIVGITAALHWLGVDVLYTRPVPLGSGMTNSLHGTIPVPAPATVKLLEGMKVRTTAMEAELTTPTGAAVLKALAERADPPDQLVIKAVGYGCGIKRFDNWPNLCRVMLCEPGKDPDAENLFKVEADIDDMMPEDSVAALDRILDAGAKDVGINPRIMKRGRPGFTISALCDEDDLKDVLSAFLMHTSTIGVRYHPIQRLILPRRQYRVSTRYGEVNIKEVVLPDGTIRTKPEYNDLYEISCRTGLTLDVLRDEVRRVMREKQQEV